MRSYVRLTPLTPEEQIFAEKNHGALLKAMKIHRLNHDMYDVAAMGYLLAVKKWFACPDLRQWSFQTIVNKTVWSTLSGEWRKQSRRIQAVSLDSEIPGTDGLTYGDTITAEHVGYLKGDNCKSMKISYDVRIPEAAKLSRVPCVEVETVLEFLASPHKNLCLEYGDIDEAKKKVGNLRSWKKNNKRDDIGIYRMGQMVFIERIKGERQNGKRTEMRDSGNPDRVSGRWKVSQGTKSGEMGRS